MTPPKLWSATYQCVPVWETAVRGFPVMMRKSDYFVNATHILKLAGLSKPQRTKILEKEISAGSFDKVQGGYGKYQGTWLPCNRARVLADIHDLGTDLFALLNQAPELIPPIYQHPTPAVKSSPTKTPKTYRRGGARNAKQTTSSSPEPTPPPILIQNSSINKYGRRKGILPTRLFADQLKSISKKEKRRTLPDEDFDFEVINPPPYSPATCFAQALVIVPVLSREDKFRKIIGLIIDDSLTLSDLDELFPVGANPDSTEGEKIDLKMTIDESNNTMMHYAMKYGSEKVITLLSEKNISTLEAKNSNNQLPFMFAVKSMQKKTLQILPKLLAIIPADQIFAADNSHHRTILHYITLKSALQSKIANEYFAIICDKLSELGGSKVDGVIALVNQQDINGDTALHNACRSGSYRQVGRLMELNAAHSMRNNDTHTPFQLIKCRKTWATWMTHRTVVFPPNGDFTHLNEQKRINEIYKITKDDSNPSTKSLESQSQSKPNLPEIPVAPAESSDIGPVQPNVFHIQDSLKIMVKEFLEVPRPLPTTSLKLPRSVQQPVSDSTKEKREKSNRVLESVDDAPETVLIRSYTTTILHGLDAAGRTPAECPSKHQTLLHVVNMFDALENGQEKRL
ncbi:hypothetical protein HK098_004340 [Nowakowskiella sp. JEL0407]|nr:hypothetical protein HK098_004340 [Nowakowskiella sp. JEL0407]